MFRYRLEPNGTCLARDYVRFDTGKMTDFWLDRTVIGIKNLIQYWRPISPIQRTAPWRIIDQTFAIAAKSRSKSVRERCGARWLRAIECLGAQE